MSGSLVLIDEPSPHVRRITLYRPEKRNALNHTLRGDLIEALQAADLDDDVRVSIVRGAGTSFSAGYDLGGGNEGLEMPHFTAPGEGHWPRHVTETWMGIWDLAKPVIAQVHGYCLAGGSELATGCDLVYVAEDAKMGYPAVRFGVPDMQFHAWFLGMRAAMEMMVTGDSISGVEAVRLGWANRAFPEAELDDAVVAVALLGVAAWAIVPGRARVEQPSESVAASAAQADAPNNPTLDTAAFDRVLWFVPPPPPVMPPSDVTASTMNSAPASCASLPISCSGCRTPVAPRRCFGASSARRCPS